ncbi:MAG TPA: PilX N-terminal domain-containing pilus assembly protein [Burkholderiaceae bacterium]|nr:PilX N-terminal domain-containing pilus assembly protein [Burkholderiaceae bacterium]
MAPRTFLVSPTRQQGVALIIGLVILVLLALLGASAYSVATQDERIAGNARDRARAMAAAETMLRDCEYHVQNGATFDPTGTTDPGMYLAPGVPGTTWLGDQVSWANLNPRLLANYLTINPDWEGGQPQCIAELLPGSALPGVKPAGLPLGGVGTPQVAHITARGYGLNSNTVVTLVSYVSWW